MGQLNGKIALVTGSSRSIGKAIAIALAKEGASLVLAARGVENLNETAREIKALGREVEVVPTDVKSEAQIDNLFKKAMKRFGRLDILVNNSGIFNGGPIDKISTQDWDDVIATNLRAAFLCTRAAFGIMKAQGGGRIINIGSISASRVRQGNAPYSSAKFGLVGLTHTTALEGREFNITCGILHPGNVERDTDPVQEAAGKTEPKMKQEEIAAAAVFMACQPPDVNVLEIIQLPKDQLYLGRG
ncbi:MAG: SDR family NAD(P)-dependent oxidoreductase [Dehalococcoidales bacterium]|jgi:NAD(P)-dependent dehydrogenase (short-subunit alcohol dehydrogenase family)